MSVVPLYSPARQFGPNSTLSWTPVLAEELTRLWNEGLSAASIAAQISRSVGFVVTKNSIISKAHRLGLSSRPSPLRRSSGPRPSRGPATGFARYRTAEGLSTEADALPGANEIFRAADLPAEHKASLRSSGASKARRKPGGVSSLTSAPVVARDGGAGVAFSELRGNHCRWPLWGAERPSEFMYCGCDVAPGRPYCEGHTAGAYTKPPARVREGRGPDAPLGDWNDRITGAKAFAR